MTPKPRFSKLPVHTKLETHDKSTKAIDELRKKVQIKTKLRIQKHLLLIKLSRIKRLDSLKDIFKVLNIPNTPANTEKLYLLLRDTGIMGGAEFSETYSASKHQKIITAFKSYYSQKINREIKKVENEIRISLPDHLAELEQRSKKTRTKPAASAPAKRTTPSAPRPASRVATKQAAPAPRPAPRPASPKPKPKATSKSAPKPPTPRTPTEKQPPARRPAAAPSAPVAPVPRLRTKPKSNIEKRLKKAINEIEEKHTQAIKEKSQASFNAFQKTLTENEDILTRANRKDIVTFYNTYIKYRQILSKWPSSKIKKATADSIDDLQGALNATNSLKNNFLNIDVARLNKKAANSYSWLLSELNKKVYQFNNRLNKISPKRIAENKAKDTFTKLAEQYKPNQLTLPKLKALAQKVSDQIYYLPETTRETTKTKYKSLQSQLKKEIESLTNDAAFRRFVEAARWKGSVTFNSFKKLYDRYDNDFDHWDSFEKQQQIKFITTAVKARLSAFSVQYRKNFKKPNQLTALRNKQQLFLDDLKNLDQDYLDPKQKKALQTWIKYNRGIPYKIDLTHYAQLKNQGLKITRVRNPRTKKYDHTKYKLSHSGLSTILKKSPDNTFNFKVGTDTFTDYSNLTDAAKAAMSELKKQAAQAKEQAKQLAQAQKAASTFNSKLASFKTGIKARAIYNATSDSIEFSYKPPLKGLTTRKQSISREDWSKQNLEKIAVFESAIFMRAQAAQSFIKSIPNLQTNGSPELTVDIDSNEISLEVPLHLKVGNKTYETTYKNIKNSNSPEKNTLTITHNDLSRTIDLTKLDNKDARLSAFQKAIKEIDPARPDNLPSDIGPLSPEQIKTLNVLSKKNIESALKLYEKSELSDYVETPFAASGPAVFLRTKSGAKAILKKIPTSLSSTTLNSEKIATYLNKNFEKAIQTNHPGTTPKALRTALTSNGLDVNSFEIHKFQTDEPLITHKLGGISIGKDADGKWWVESIKGPSSNTNGPYENFTNLQQAVQVLAAITKDFDKAGRNTYRTYKSGNEYFLNDKTWPRSDTPLKNINALPSGLRSRAYSLFKTYRAETKAFESKTNSIQKSEKLLITSAAGRPADTLSISLTSDLKKTLTLKKSGNNYKIEGTSLSFPLAKAMKVAKAILTAPSKSSKLPSGVTSQALAKARNQIAIKRLETTPGRNGNINYFDIKRYGEHLNRNQRLRLHQTAYHLSQANKFFNDLPQNLKGMLEKYEISTSTLKSLLPLMIRENKLRTLYSPEANKLSRRLPHMKDGLFQLYNFKKINTAHSFMQFNITRDVLRVARRIDRANFQTFKARLQALAQSTFSEQNKESFLRKKETLSVILGALYFQGLRQYEIKKLPRANSLSAEDKQKIAYGMFNMGPTAIRNIWKRYNCTSAEDLMNKLTRLSRAVLRGGRFRQPFVKADRGINVKFGADPAIQRYFQLKRLARSSNRSVRRRARHALSRRVRFLAGIRPQAQKPAITYLYIRQIAAIEKDLRSTTKKITNKKLPASIAPKTSPTQRPANSPNTFTHTVQKNESLWKIVRKYKSQISKNPKYKGYSIRKLINLIKKANKIKKAYLIGPGQKLIIPGIKSAAKIAAEKTAAKETQRLKNYLAGTLGTRIPKILNHVRINTNEKGELSSMDVHLGERTVQIKSHGRESWKIQGIDISLTPAAAANNAYQFLKTLNKFNGKSGVFVKNKSINTSEIQFDPAGINFFNETALKVGQLVVSSGTNSQEIIDSAVKFLNENLKKKL